MMYNTEIEGFKLRDAEILDIPLYLELLKELAVYEKLENELIVTREDVEETVFKNNRAEILISEYNNETVGYIVYFYNFSTFTSRAGLYIEDIYIREKFRGKGFGKEIFKFLAEKAKENKCRRMEWVCLNWNKSAQSFYKSLGALPMDEWTTFRLNEQDINKLTKYYKY